MWNFVLDIEDNEELLKEYGRAIILLTNVEYFLKDIIKRKSGNTIEKELGVLINASAPYLSSTLITRLKKLNEKRIIIVHGAVVRFGKSNLQRETDKILKIDKHTNLETAYPLTKTYLKRISESARKLVRALNDVR